MIEGDALFSDEDRSAHLLMAAHAILGESGLQGLTIQAVLRRTGLARRAFYDCYGGKDELLIAVFAHTLKQGSEYYRSEAEKCSSYREALQRVVTGVVVNAYFDDGSGNLNRSLAFAQEHLKLAAFHPERLEAAIAPLIGLIADLLEQGGRSGEFDPGDPALTARLIYNLISATMHSEIIKGTSSASVKNKIADGIWRFCSRAIRIDCDH